MKRIIVTGARAPVALHWARLLKAAGHRVVIADTPRFPIARFTRSIDRHVRLPGPALSGLPVYAEAWTRLLDEERPDLVVPTCEEVFHLAALRDRRQLPLPLLAPGLERLAEVHDKFRFARMAASLAGTGPGRPPKTWLVRNAEDAAPLIGQSTDLVLKPVWSRFAARVIRRPEPRLMAGMDWQKGGPWVAQTFLPGEELSVYALAHQGRLVALQTYRGLFRAAGGASVAFEPCEEKDIERFVTDFVAASTWHGQVAFDFRRDETGAVRVLECNPRAVSGLHFFAPDDDLASTLFDGKPTRASLCRPQTVRLALVTYGLVDALGSGRIGDWSNVLRGSDDLTDSPGDPGFLLPQFLSLGEIAFEAMRRRTGLRSAATADIEWNGGPL